MESVVFNDWHDNLDVASFGLTHSDWPWWQTEGFEDHAFESERFTCSSVPQSMERPSESSLPIFELDYLEIGDSSSQLTYGHYLAEAMPSEPPVAEDLFGILGSDSSDSHSTNTVKENFNRPLVEGNVTTCRPPLQIANTAVSDRLHNRIRSSDEALLLERGDARHELREIIRKRNQETRIQRYTPKLHNANKRYKCCGVTNKKYSVIQW